MYMYILHSCAETDSELFLIDLCYSLCIIGLVKGGGSAPLSPFRGKTVPEYAMSRPYC